MLCVHTFLSATNFNGSICVTPPVPFELPGDAIGLIIGGFSIFVLNLNEEKMKEMKIRTKAICVGDE